MDKEENLCLAKLKKEEAGMVKYLSSLTDSFGRPVFQVRFLQLLKYHEEYEDYDTDEEFYYDILPKKWLDLDGNEVKHKMIADPGKHVCISCVCVWGGGIFVLHNFQLTIFVHRDKTRICNVRMCVPYVTYFLFYILERYVSNFLSHLLATVNEL